MTLLEAILKLLGLANDNRTVGRLKEILAGIVGRLPDTAGELNPIIAALDAAVTPEGIDGLVKALPPEILNILRLKIDPRPHAGDGM